MSNKSQATIIDFSLAIIMFLSIFLINFYSWNSIETKISNNEDYHYFFTSVNQAVESLITKSGEAYWEDNPINASRIGLAGKPNVLDNEKLSALASTNYTILKDLVLSTGNYELIISNDSGIIYQTGLSAKGEIISVERLVIINDSFYKLVFKGWRE